jgi:formylglycine-generating enzyme required for sulfatase activity/uncharacterized caspase-like protein
MPKNWAISIGINGYKYANIRPLKYAKQDALLVRNFFRDDLKFDRVLLFSDDSPEIEGESTHPDRTPLLRFFRMQFENPFMSQEDSLWLFFSGHGMRFADRDYLLPIDGDREAPEDTAICLDHVSERLSRSGAGTVVIILDACRDEGRKGQSFGNDLYEGITTIFSCRPNESSWEIDEPISQGAFTHALLSNLKEQVQGNCLTVEETEYDLQKRLRALNQQYKKPTQTPHIRCDSANKANRLLLPENLLARRSTTESQSQKANRQKRTSHRRSTKNFLLLKSSAVEAEEKGQFELARQKWLQILDVFPSEREAAIQAIDRIAVRQASQPFLSNVGEAAGQSLTDTQEELIIKSASITDTALKMAQRKQEVVVPFVPNTQLHSFVVITIDRNGKLVESFQSQTHCYIEKIDSEILEMIVIPGGTFSMGSSGRKTLHNELPIHEVTVQPFLLSKSPITKELWRKVSSLPKVHQELKLRPSLRGSKQHPVVEISCFEATEFCNRLSQATGLDYRLPTEAEWEYACRAGTTTPFHFGEAITSELANFDTKQIVKVGNFPFANAFGLMDMHGNVWEWCQDHWHDNYHGAPTDGTAWLDNNHNQSHVMRGGSWRNEASLCRSSFRLSGAFGQAFNNVGFRVARSL